MKSTVESGILTEIQDCKDRLSEAQGQIAAWVKSRDEAQRKIKETDVQIQSLEGEIKRLDLNIQGLGAQWAREEITFETAKLKASEIAKSRSDKALAIQLLRGGRPVLEKRQASLIEPDPMTGQSPFAKASAIDAMLNQQILFWELLEKYRATGDGKVEREMLNKANYCKFTEDERDKADQMYRQVREELGLFCNFSSRQVGGYQKPEPWPGC